MGTPERRLAREIPPIISRIVPPRLTNKTVVVTAPTLGSFVFLWIQFTILSKKGPMATASVTRSGRMKLLTT